MGHSQLLWNDFNQADLSSPSMKRLHGNGLHSGAVSTIPEAKDSIRAAHRHHVRVNTLRTGDAHRHPALCDVGGQGHAALTMKSCKNAWRRN